MLQVGLLTWGSTHGSPKTSSVCLMDRKKKRGRKVSWVRFVYRLNFLMTFSLKVPAAKYCLLLPLELSALIMRGSTWKLFT